MQTNIYLGQSVVIQKPGNRPCRNQQGVVMKVIHPSTSRKGPKVMLEDGTIGYVCRTIEDPMCIAAKG